MANTAKALAATEWERMEHERMLHALAAGGVNPAVTDPGVTGVGPTGGGRAVPDVDVFEDDAFIGDNETLADDTLTDVEDETGIPVAEEVRALPSGYVPSSTGYAPVGGVPTGGLEPEGTIGGIPTGEA